MSYHNSHADDSGIQDDAGTNKGTNSNQDLESAETVASKPSMPEGPPVIPEDINSYDRLEATRYYVDKLGWAVQPLYGPAKGNEFEKGKKPLLPGWRSHTTAEIDPEFFGTHFGPTSSNNIGCVVRSPFVFVDLDSKPDKGESVRGWLASMPELAAVPRERTGGGAHLVFVCHDLPEEVLDQNQALTVKITDNVQAEFYKDGLNIVLSPSVHKSGEQYRWDVTGEIPVVRWAQLCQWFGFETPAKKRGPGRPRKDPPWWSKYPEDLGTLDLVSALKTLDAPLRELDSKKSMWGLRCPWCEEHSTEPPASPGTETVVFVPSGKRPAFNCKHAHCTDRSLKDLAGWMEGQRPGIIADHCTALREWSRGKTDNRGRPEIVMGGVGRPDSEFAAELGEAIGEKQLMFRRDQDVVEIRTEPTDKIEITHFHVLTPKEFVTAIETHVAIGYLREDADETRVFVSMSLSEKAARVILASSAFRDKLPQIDRILDTPIPMLGAGGEIVYPKSGYDPEFRTWLDPHAPQLISMTVEEAILVLNDLLAGPDQGGFWWKNRQSRTHALARLATPFLRGLMDWQKGPVWIIDGNAPGVGKDTFASVVTTVHTGRESTGAPLSKMNDDELRKRITSALRAGIRQIHFANVKGHIDFPSLEAATDNSGVWEDRLLGQSKHLSLRNEAEYSMSCNNATWTPDLERRSRCIFLHCPLEHPDRHQYSQAEPLRVVRENRSLVISALAALTRHWDEQGRPSGPTSFTSFHRWGRVVGGVLVACGYPDPCLPQKQESLGGDQKTIAMRLFFQVAFEMFSDKPVSKKKFLDFVKDDEFTHELFDDIDFSTRTDISGFSKLVLSYCGRSLGGITLTYSRHSKNLGDYQFVRGAGSHEGVGGCEGRVPVDLQVEENIPSCSMNGGVFNRLLPNTHNNVPDVPLPPLRLPVIFCKSADTVKKMARGLNSARRVVATLSPTTLDASQESSSNLDDHQLSLQGDSGGTIWVIDDRDVHLRRSIELALRITILLPGKPVVTHEGIRLLQWLGNRYQLRLGTVRCLSTAARLLENGIDVPHDLGSCLARYCPVVTPKGSHQALRLKLEAPDPLARKVDDRVLRLPELHAALEETISSNGLEQVWDLENRLLPVIADLRDTGIFVNVDKLKGLAERGQKGAEGLLKHVDEDGRIRSTFDPLGTVTGRCTSTDPALQQVPKGPVRGAFRPSSQDRIFVSADYCQHDIRVLAAVSGDEPLKDTFDRDEDYHREMAASLLDKTPDQVTDEERNIAKAFSIGIVYGRTPAGIAETALNDFGITIEQPEMKLVAFLDDHPGYANWVAECRERARAGCDEVRTRLGRRRITPPEVERGKRQRILMNTPIQGGAADAFKEAMVLVHRRLPTGAKIVHCIHDELILECAMDQAEEVEAILERSMIEGMQKLYPEVKAKVETTVGEFWGDKD